MKAGISQATTYPFYKLTYGATKQPAGSGTRILELILKCRSSGQDWNFNLNLTQFLSQKVSDEKECGPKKITERAERSKRQSSSTNGIPREK